MPSWLSDARFYEVYPQTFLDTDADGVGDLRGIIEKLDYVRELGCNALWLNPCFVSPFLDAGYDVEDFCTVAPRYGTNQDLKDLFDEAHARGMHVLLDLVPGHTSVEHPWFKASCCAEPNEFWDRYIWTEHVFDIPDGMGCIRGMSERDGCCAVNFFSHQPALNYGFENPDPEKPWQQPTDAPGPQATVRAMIEVMRFWLGLGADGFRCDMANSLVKNDPEYAGTMRVWRQVRAFLDEEFPEAAIVSEWGEPDYSLPGGFHMDFLLQFGTSHCNDLVRCEAPYFSADPAGDASRFVAAYRAYAEKTAGQGLMCLISGNHDCDRLSLRLDDRAERLCFAFQLTMPGAPFIYCGDEIGMRHIGGRPSKEGSYWRTGARTPMQWDSTPNCGFSAAPPAALYLGVDPAEDRPTVAAQMADEGSLWHTVRALLELRAAHPALGNDAPVEFLADGAGHGVLAYVREAAGERVLVAINPDEREQSFASDLEPGDVLFSVGGELTLCDRLIAVPPRTAVVCIL